VGIDPFRRFAKLRRGMHTHRRANSAERLAYRFTTGRQKRDAVMNTILFFMIYGGCRLGATQSRNSDSGLRQRTPTCPPYQPEDTSGSLLRGALPRNSLQNVSLRCDPVVQLLAICR